MTQKVEVYDKEKEQDWLGKIMQPIKDWWADYWQTEKELSKIEKQAFVEERKIVARENGIRKARKLRNDKNTGLNIGIMRPDFLDEKQ